MTCAMPIRCDVTAIVPPEPDDAGQWQALCLRTSGNVFMHPAALGAAHATGLARPGVLRAWLREGASERLIGVWALCASSPAPWGAPVLAAPPYKYAVIANPVLDPDFMDEAVSALLDGIERHPSLPKVLRLRSLDTQCATYAALCRALVARGARVLKPWEGERPFVTRAMGVRRSGATRKKLRQHWNRLRALGAVEVRNDRSPDAARDALETFLTMEAASWKGVRGTALLCDPRDARFARRFIGGLAAQRCASVALLKIDGCPIAAQVLLYSGSVAYTWKTTFDSAFGRFSPGALLVDRITEQLLATGYEAIESCARSGGFMDQIWAGRRACANLLVHLGERKSPGYIAAASSEWAYVQLRAIRNRLRSVVWA